MERQRPGESGYDIKIIEDNKENILPLREGRKVSQLSELYSKSAEEREAELEGQKRRFEELLTTAQDKEVFEIYSSYINWTLNNYPEGQSLQSNLFHLLERACWKFCKDPEYKEDHRYFGFWASYIKLTDKPVEIFALLDADKIGVCLSMRYEEEANYYEQQKQFHLALKAYQKGFEHQTVPIGALEKSFQSFQKRISGLEGAAWNQPRFVPPQLANGNPGYIRLDSTYLPPKRKRLVIFRDPEGTCELQEGSDNTHISNYGPKDIRTRQNIPSQTAWNALKIPQGTVARPCQRKIRVMKDDPETKAAPPDSGLHLTSSSKAGASAYFIEKGSAVLDVKFNILASKEPLNPGSKPEVPVEEHRYISMNTEAKFRQPGSHKPLSNSKSIKETFYQSLHRKKAYTELTSSSKSKATIQFTSSANMPEVRKKKLSGLPRCSSIHTERFKRPQLISLYTEEPEAARGDEGDEYTLPYITDKDGNPTNCSNTHSAFGLDSLDVTLPKSNHLIFLLLTFQLVHLTC
ncbi:protein kinase, variant 2 [Entomophthora muscae]|uniref:Protein kinase, variant 2 n=1 Tax=Entomophthora muscae TaxID=34485 RepID=A0ACC2U4N4_9FUNG|nr:protein kinase, variant 2 [Entomophthora muscae]